MRPTLQEFLRAFKSNLDTIILPDLRSPWPVTMATNMSGLLEHLMLRYEQGPDLLREANAQLRDLLEDAAQALGHSLPADTRERIESALATSRDRDPDHACLELLMEDNDRLGAALEAVLRLPEEALGGEANAALLSRMQDTLSRQLQTEYTRLIEPLMLTARG
jgi:hypothetical protein